MQEQFGQRQRKTKRSGAFARLVSGADGSICCCRDHRVCYCAVHLARRTIHRGRSSLWPSRKRAARSGPSRPARARSTPSLAISPTASLREGDPQSGNTTPSGRHRNRCWSAGDKNGQRLEARRIQAAMYIAFSSTYLARGNAELAVASAKTGCNIFRALAAAEPNNDEIQSNVGLGLQRLGEALRAQRRHQGRAHGRSREPGNCTRACQQRARQPAISYRRRACIVAAWLGGG